MNSIHIFLLYFFSSGFIGKISSNYQFIL